MSIRWSRLLAVVISCLAVGTLAAPAQATHFRSGNLTWNETETEREANYSLTLTFRRSYFAAVPPYSTTNLPVVGSSISLPQTNSDPFNFGLNSGSTAGNNPIGKVVAVNTAEDFLVLQVGGTPPPTGALPFTHLFPAIGPYTSTYQGCCSLSNLTLGNNDQTYRASTRVQFGSGSDGAPVSSVTPIVDFGKSTTQRYTIPAIDPASRTLTYRLATTAESGIIKQPTGLTIDAITGRISWDTSPATIVAGLYSVAVVIEARQSNATSPVVASSAVTFLIRVSTATTNSKPDWDTPPTPANLTEYTVARNEPLTVSLRATDPNAGQTTHIDNLGLPAGASFTSTDGRTANATFSWTPVALGDTLVTFSAQDDQVPVGSASTRTIVIHVKDLPPTVNLVATPASGPRGLAVIFDTAGTADPDGVSDLTGWTVDYGDGSPTDSGPGAPPLSIHHTYADKGEYTARLTVLDSTGAPFSKTEQITVTNSAPTAQLTPIPDSGPRDLQVSFSTAGTTDPDGDGDLASYRLDFGDGTTESLGDAPIPATVSHTYTQKGTYTARLTIVDADDDDDADTAAVTVTNSPPVARLSADPDTGPTDLLVTFDGSASSDADGPADIGSFSLNYGDGLTAIGVGAPPSSLTHTYEGKGTYTATLKVNDVDGGTDTTTKTITVVNSAPVARLDASPVSGPRGLAVTFDGSATSDADGAPDLASYEVDFGDGTPVASGAGLPPASLLHTYADKGSYTATLTVKDDEDATDSTTESITVTNTAPVAALAAAPVTGPRGLEVTFDGSGSSDPDGSADLASYELDFGDGTPVQTGSGLPDASIEHTYADKGSYTATLTVKDEGDATDSATKSITVTNTAPVAALAAAPVSGPRGLEVTFDGSGSSDPDGSADLASYELNFGDGTAVQIGIGVPPAAIAHTYASKGSYTATLTVKDTEDATDSATKAITVTNTAPVAALAAAPTTGPRGLVVTFDGSGSSDPDGSADLASYELDFGDGTPVSTGTGMPPAALAHTYAAKGGYTAKLTVKDADGAADSVTKAITVTNSAPVAGLSAAPTSGPTGLQVTFDTSTTSDPDGAADLASYTFDFGDGGAPVSGSGVPPLAPTHIYTQKGPHVVRLTVTDVSGATSFVERTITVTNSAPVAALSATTATGEAPLAVTFATAGTSDPDGAADIVSSVLSFGDGTPNVTTAGLPAASTAHAYATPGTFEAKLTVTDASGATSVAATKTVVVTKAGTQLIADASVVTVKLFSLSITFKPVAHLKRKIGGAPIAGKTIKFTSTLGSTICTATTDATGTASCTGILSVLQTVLGYNAKFAGDTVYTASAGSATLIRIG